LLAGSSGIVAASPTGLPSRSMSAARRGCVASRSGTRPPSNARWAQWAIEQVETWPDTTKPADIEAALEVFHSVLQSAAATE
jgi:hypothetical protein